MVLGNDLALIAIRGKGAKIAKAISDNLGGTLYVKKGIEIKGSEGFDELKEIFKYVFGEYRFIVAVMAQGIVTRMIHNLPKNKYTDPALVVVDEGGRYSIAMLSGHEGKANRLSYEVSSIIGCEPVVTTATEANKRFVLGIGCRADVSSKSVEEAVNRTCGLIGIDVQDIRVAASCWYKKGEKGLVEAMDRLGLNIRFLPKMLYSNELYNFKESAALKYLGIKNVAEASALLAAKNPKLVLEKTVFNSVTIAVAEEQLYG